MTDGLVPGGLPTIADLQRGMNAGELRSVAEPELLNGAIFGAIYYRLLLRSGPLTKRFGEELVEQVIRGHRSKCESPHLYDSARSSSQST
jgi:Tetracyclin repressor-like, C-terminal domain